MCRMPNGKKYYLRIFTPWQESRIQNVHLRESIGIAILKEVIIVRLVEMHFLNQMLNLQVIVVGLVSMNPLEKIASPIKRITLLECIVLRCFVDVVMLILVISSMMVHPRPINDFVLTLSVLTLNLKWLFCVT